MSRHHKHGPATAAVDKHGDITNIRGTIEEPSIARPYAPVPTPDPKESK